MHFVCTFMCEIKMAEGKYASKYFALMNENWAKLLIIMPELGRKKVPQNTSCFILMGSQVLKKLLHVLQS